MKYDARACKFNMDTGCVELLKISFRQPEVVLALAKMVHDVHERSNVQNPLD